MLGNQYVNLMVVISVCRLTTTCIVVLILSTLAIFQVFMNIAWLDIVRWLYLGDFKWQKQLSVGTILRSNELLNRCLEYNILKLGSGNKEHASNSSHFCTKSTASSFRVLPHSFLLDFPPPASPPVLHPTIHNPDFALHPPSLHPSALIPPSLMSAAVHHLSRPSSIKCNKPF